MKRNKIIHDSSFLCYYQDVLSECPAVVENLKTQLESVLVTSEPEYSKYYNFPSCSAGEGLERVIS